MKSILLIIESPSAGDDQRLNKWLRFAETVAGVSKTNKGCDVLNAGTFLIHANGGLSFLSHAIRQAEQDGFRYRVLFLEESSELPS